MHKNVFLELIINALCHSLQSTVFFYHIILEVAHLQFLPYHLLASFLYIFLSTFWLAFPYLITLNLSSEIGSVYRSFNDLHIDRYPVPYPIVFFVQ